MGSFATLMFTALFAAAPVEGNPQSPVRVLIFEDLQCGDCARFREMLDQHLLARFGARVAFEHHDYPLAKHTWARRAATAARFFDTQNPKVGIEFRRQVLANLGQIRAEELSAWVAAFARQFAIDPVKAIESMRQPALMAQVDKDSAEAVARGVTKTPTIFVDGEPFVETFTLEAITQGIESAIAKARDHK